MSDIDRVWGYGNCAFWMFATWTGSRLRSRPMSASVSRDQNVIRFLTDVRQHKDEEVREFPQVCLAFAIRVTRNTFQFPGMPRSQMTAKRSKVCGPFLQGVVAKCR